MCALITCMCTDIYMYIFVCICIYIYVCVYIYKICIFLCMYCRSKLDDLSEKI